MKNLFLSILLCLCIQASCGQPSEADNLKFPSLPTRWDHGFPLGNGMIGVLVWQKDSMLRLSVDRADLWDLRPTVDIKKYTYKWAYQHRIKGDFDTVWKVADLPYDRDAAPTKIPGAAIEFNISKLGEIETACLDLKSASCIVKWKNGVEFSIFVDANSHLARYKWYNFTPVPDLKAPQYTSSSVNPSENQVVGGSDLRRLGYSEGKIIREKNSIIYRQKAWGPLSYEAAVRYKMNGKDEEGCFTISSHYSDLPPAEAAGNSY